jgi:hypothetical protein
MIPEELEAKCKELCPHCKAGEPVRRRLDTFEWVHDFSFGAPEVTPFGRRQQGHSICDAHELRTQNGQSRAG